MSKGNPELTHARGVPPERMFVQACANRDYIIHFCDDFLAPKMNPARNSGMLYTIDLATCMDIVQAENVYTSWALYCLLR
jgi:hypothetical protein